MRVSSDSSRGNGIAHRARGMHRLLALLFAVLAVRLVVLQVVEHDRYRRDAQENILRQETLPAIRGVIRDRQGRVLVDSVPSFTVAIDPYHGAYLQHRAVIDSTLAWLAPHLGLPADSMAALVEREKNRSYRPVRLKRNLSDSTVAYVEEHRDRLPGVIIELEPRRRYVHGKLAAHVLGHVGEVSEAELRGAGGSRKYAAGDRVGRTGIERLLEPRLCGANGQRFVEVTALGRRARPRGAVAGGRASAAAVSDRRQESLRPAPPELPIAFASLASTVPPAHGDDVTLTLDLEIQQAAEEAFPAGFAGAAVVIDVRDGGILAILSRPAYDPNAFAIGLTPARWRQMHDDPLHPQHNRALQSGYPPGSVFKVVTGMAALAAGGVGPRDVFAPCDGGWQFGNRWFGCHHVHGVTTFEQAMLLSCDVYFYQVGLRAGLDALSEYARALGLGRPTGVELPETSGLVPDADWYDANYGKHGWTRGNVVNLAIGQGEILTTPLQLAGMMATIARGGRPLTPHLVRAIGGQPQPVAAPTQRLDAGRSTLKSMVHALEQVVAHPRGTGKQARVAGVRVAAKTGTAQNPHGEDHAVFAGFAPVEAPRIAFAVVIENGGHGGATAAPVAAALIRACLLDHPELWGSELTASGRRGAGTRPVVEGD